MRSTWKNLSDLLPIVKTALQRGQSDAKRVYEELQPKVLDKKQQGEALLKKYYPRAVKAGKKLKEKGEALIREKITPSENSNMKKLNNISDIRRYFHRNETPIYFISATNFNLLGISEWVRNFRYINYLDCFDSRHPNVRIPTEQPHREFSGIEDINNYLLQHKEVVDYIDYRGPGGKAVFLMFDQETESLCKDLGLEVWFPSADLRQKMDNKIETVRIGNRAGVPSVPNVLAKVESYAQLKEVSKELGDDLVLQSAFGDSGKTTYFISSEEDWDKHAAGIVGEPETKIMKRVNCRGSAIEACTTKQGTIVGPLMTELVGFPELTPYKGGWCGNEIFAEAFTQDIRDKARNYTQVIW